MEIILCNKCQQPKTILELTDAKKYNCRRLCFPCERERQRERQHRAYLANPEKHRTMNRTSYHKNHEANILSQRKQRLKLRYDILFHYSKGKMECACCLTNIEVFLTIDHLNGGGTMDRRNTGGGGHHLYRKLRKQGFPSGFQVLCYNCNIGKAKPEGCPHKLLEGLK